MTGVLAMQLINKASSLISDIKTHWNTPAEGKYVPYRGIFGYSVGGIGAYMIITMATTCLLAANNTLLSMALAIEPTDIYVMYIICVIANIPMTGIRANIIDNTRNKAGKYRPYVFRMAVPSALLCLATVCFPYDTLFPSIFGDSMIFGKEAAYVAKCATVLIFNLLLHFFYYFFYDAYENLVYVLSPDSQERANIASVKSIVYSFAPTVVNLITPIIAENIFHTNTTDLKVYKLLYPILTVLGLLLCILVYTNTEEKIVQAKTHVIKIKFTDALKAVAKNKYFWIISLAGWIGFLESSYSNILSWLYNYGGACSGNEYGIIVTVYGNASLWGMLFAPFAIKKWGKKAVLVTTNIFNIVFILMMLPCCQDITHATIWLVMGCLWLNALMGSFAHILNPAIQADIRDYQQYKTGERIDGMFSAVGTIGTVITLATSGVLPWVYEQGGLTRANAKVVTSNPEILNRVLGDGKTTVGQILSQQLESGQDNYSNALSALYDTDILLSLIKVLILLAAFGAFMNVIPYIWYDFSEKKQKSVIRVLKIRAMFEDYSNGFVSDEELTEGMEIIKTSFDTVKGNKPAKLDKALYKKAGKQDKKQAKAAYNAAKEKAEEYDICVFVTEELQKYSTTVGKFRLAQAQSIFSQGINAPLHADEAELKSRLSEARNSPKANADEKEMRKIAMENAKAAIAANKAAKKYFAGESSLTAPSFTHLEALFAEEDETDSKLKELYTELRKAQKSHDKAAVRSLKEKTDSLNRRKKELQKEIKKENDTQSFLTRAAKPYLDAEKLIKQSENYTNLDAMEEKYNEAKLRLANQNTARA